MQLAAGSLLWLARPVEPPRIPAVLDEVGHVDLAGETALDGVLVTSAALADGEAPLVDITGSRLVGLRLTAAVLERIRLTDVVLEGCELSGAELSEANLVRVRFERCRMTGAVLSMSRGRGVTFEDCKLVDAQLRMADLERCRLVDSDLTGADLTAARVVDSRILRCTLDRSQLSKADLAAPPCTARPSRASKVREPYGAR